MSRTCKSPRRVAAWALGIADAILPRYSHPCSPKTFTQPQLFACLALKVLQRTDYRGIALFLDERDDIVQQLDLVPACFTYMGEHFGNHLQIWQGIHMPVRLETEIGILEIGI